MFVHGAHFPASARMLRAAFALCTTVALCMAVPLTASAISRTGAIPVTTLRDASCPGDDPIALASIPDGRFLFAIGGDGTVCKIDASDMSAEGAIRVDGGFDTSRPHIEFTPDDETMLINGAKGICAIDVTNLTTTLHPSTGNDYMLSPDGTRIGVIEPDGTTDDGADTSQSWTLRTFAVAGGEDVATVPLRLADAGDAATGIHDVTPYTTNSAGTVWFASIDDATGTGDRPSRLVAIDIATGVMDTIADDVSPTMYATGTMNHHALYVGTSDSRVLSVDVDAYKRGSDSDSTSTSTETVTRMAFGRHLPLDRILLAPNGTRMLVGMTNDRLVADESTMQWLDTGDLVSAINPDGTLLYSIDRGDGGGTRAGNSVGTNDADGTIVFRVNTFAKDDPTVTRTLSLAGETGAAYDRAAGYTFSQNGGIWFVLLAPVAGSKQPPALLAVDVSPFTTESVKWSTSGNGRRPLSTPTIAIVAAGATLLVVVIVIVRRRTPW